MRARITGTLEPVTTGRRTSYDPARGIVFTEELESAGENLDGVAQALLLEQVQFEHRPSGRKSKLSYTTTTTPGGVEVPIDTWQVLGNEISEDIKGHPAIVALDEAGTINFQEIQNNVELYRASTGDMDVPYEDGPELQIFNLLVRGVTSYVRGQYVLRHTTNVSNRYNVNVSDQNIEKVYTTAQLVAEITNVSLWVNPCPGRLVYKIQNIEQQIDDSDDIRWGWRKLPSTETTGANNRIDIATEYVLYGWSKLLYEAAT